MAPSCARVQHATCVQEALNVRKPVVFMKHTPCRDSNRSSLTLPIPAARRPDTARGVIETPGSDRSTTNAAKIAVFDRDVNNEHVGDKGAR